MSCKETMARALMRHPWLRPIDYKTMISLHPVRTAVYHGNNGPSIYMYPFCKAVQYKDRLLADGNTIEFYPSTSDVVNGQLNKLVGRTVPFYTLLGGGICRQGRVAVSRSTTLNGVYNLEISPAPAPAPAPAAATAPAPAPVDYAVAVGEKPRAVCWADMLD